MNSLCKYQIILIDNFDSFTYNLVNQLSPYVEKVKVYRNNTSLTQLMENEFADKQQKIIVLSPGPGSPNTAGITLELINQLKGNVPILGICLGHQSIIQSYSGEIGSAKSIVHGKTYDIFLDQDENSIFSGLNQPFRAARYHSLAATKIPETLKVIATSSDEEVMAVHHITDKVLGFQFHPESILTPQGGVLMEKSLQWLADDAH